MRVFRFFILFWWQFKVMDCTLENIGKRREICSVQFVDRCEEIQEKLKTIKKQDI